MTDSSPSIPSQLEFFDVPSPCIGVCESGRRGYCKGCFRSRDERRFWYQADTATRRQIVAACYKRKQAAQRRARQHDKPSSAGPTQFELFDNT
ncbi:DUF1289 domain-containing protein [Salinimonas marina]|uniref:DUF1289 domain-containing protein n=1 Tax=Salinimonas marina TaxID=2785918 RepID=A0A7S9DYH2_9ALTE|nr:DUF1289 domain-containing protein [Salinimonas marina]QPG06312.1 DUF1289 domain-containing protein [Salinimonas marina]